MIGTMRVMLACAWSGRRIQRYLDGERGLPLTADEARRLERHLDACRRCTAVLQQHRLLQGLLRGWSARREPDPETVARVRAGLDRILSEEQR